MRGGENAFSGTPCPPTKNRLLPGDVTRAGRSLSGRERCSVFGSLLKKTGPLVFCARVLTGLKHSAKISSPDVRQTIGGPNPSYFWILVQEPTILFSFAVIVIFSIIIIPLEYFFADIVSREFSTCRRLYWQTKNMTNGVNSTH